MVAFAGIGSYGNVFHTKIARSSRRACNFVIPKDRWEPAVFSIPIARSNPRHRCPLGANSALGRVSRSMFVEIGCHLGIGWLGATCRTDWFDVFGEFAYEAAPRVSALDAFVGREEIK
jgi:hypothetical protein